MARLAHYDVENLVVLNDLTSKATLVKSARIDEGLSRLTEIVVEFACDDVQLELDKLIGRQAALGAMLPDGVSRRDYCGICVEARLVGFDDVFEAPGHFEVTLRPWLWFLTRRRNSRIFQEMTTDDIIRRIFDDAGYSAQNYRIALKQEYDVRDYCVQYLETDYDFVCRLMEEVGIYFFFEHGEGRETLVLADDISAHSKVPGGEIIPYRQSGGQDLLSEDHVFEWGQSRRAIMDGVTYSDYDFIVPTKKMSTEAKADGSLGRIRHGYGRYPPVSENDEFSRVRDEFFAQVSLASDETESERWRGACNVRRLAAGHMFKLEKNALHDADRDYLVINATHYLRNDLPRLPIEPMMRATFTGPPHPGLRNTQDKIEATGWYAEDSDLYSSVIEASPHDVPFRAPQSTPRPSIPGIQTAVVVGPSGERIHTDRHGRVRVRFHWDPMTKGETAARRKDELTCWTRVMQPWTGQGWGTVAIPRVGQEVVVQFENGDPDRPVVTGMMYNGDNMPPYGLPDNKTMSGTKTQTVGGGSDSFSEFVIEDKKGEEYVRLQSERDYTEIIKNNAVITIGMEHKDPGDLTQTVQNHKSVTIEKGNLTETVKSGDRILTVDKGDLTETVKVGNYSHKTSAGKITVEAAQSIELKVAGSSIKIDPSGVTIKGPMVKIDASGMAEMKSGGMTSVKGGAIVMVKGPITMIN